MKDTMGYRLKKDWFDVFNYILMIFLGLITLFPIYYVFILSFADYAAVKSQLVYILPNSFDLEAYKLVFKGEMFVNSFFVSVFVTVAGTAFSMILSTAAAYTLSKKYVPGGKFLFCLIIIPMFFSGGLIPSYLNIKDLGLIDKIWVLIIPGAVSSFYLILLKNFFEELPVSVEESARIDGANDLRILWSIVLPMSAAVIATISLFCAVDRWNEYYTALLYINDKRLRPLQLILREAIVNYQMLMSSPIGAEIASKNRPMYSESLKSAIIVVSTIPILCVYPFLQKHFTKGIVFGAVKE